MTKKLSGLYAITNETLMPENLFLSMAEAALTSGVSVLQYRDKSTNQKKRQYQASQLKLLCDQHSVTFIINDDINLAMQVDADGVHIGKNDQSIYETKNQLGKDKIIGVSCYNQMSLATDAIENGADYIAFGSFFGSSIKPEAPQANRELITTIKNQYSTPVCCIGGITTENHKPLLDAGTDMLAIISDIFSHTDNAYISHQCTQFKNAFDSRKTG
ncbi:MAG: thiamine phosphate synthase [endosymbiont of Galathealinum brachiosum]|uniref:Thiamine-phosphate synthase n=1 Tax=endosymbiont of Galathealinum brachiosum TaxID=2200906 RepID=A0A370DAM8_9GAMM|nr:MAG: thiamine phosphate synthase [endosymbiont of Galathealinum brachiosum]